MKRWMKNIKWFVAASSLLALFASASVAYGGIRWSGIDPMFKVNDSQINITVWVPTENLCDIEDINFRVRVAEDAEVSRVLESSEKALCRDGVHDIVTDTNLFQRGKGDTMRVAGTVEASERFPVRILVQENRTKLQICRGVSNNEIVCDPVKLGR